MSGGTARVVLRRLGLGLAILALLAFTAFPLVWMAATAFKPSQELLAWPPRLIPKKATLANIVHLLEQTRFLVYFRNSVYVASATVLLTLAVATPGAYSLTRFRFRGRETIARDHPVHVHVRADHDHYPVLCDDPPSRARQHASRAHPCLHRTQRAVRAVDAAHLFPEPSRSIWRRPPSPTAPADGAPSST